MHYKLEVLKRVPHAEARVVERASDGLPRFVAVFIGDRRLDPRPEIYQGYGPAWRSAFYALRRIKNGDGAPLYRQRGKGTHGNG